jgi:hypothetical protein
LVSQNSTSVFRNPAGGITGGFSVWFKPDLLLQLIRLMDAKRREKYIAEFFKTFYFF